LKPPVPPYEAERLETLRSYQVLDTLPEREFDDLALLASHVCETPSSAISLVDEHRQWFKARVGLSVTETARDMAFCAHAICRRELFIVPDARADERFAGHPWVTGGSKIRFYAGAPLTTPEGHALGTLCVADQTPRSLSAAQQDALRALARQVMSRLELRRERIERRQAEHELRVRTSQHAVVTELSLRALAGESPQELMQAAVALVAHTLQAELAGVWKLRTESAACSLKAGIGWNNHRVARATVPVGGDTPDGLTLLRQEPVTVEDFRTDARFRAPALLRDHGIVSSLTVVIPNNGQPYGALGAYTTQPRAFTSHDVYFLQSVAHVLAVAIHRQDAERQMKQLEAQLLQSPTAEALDAGDGELERTESNPVGEK
jgi:GAF domain-containing protein